MCFCFITLLASDIYNNKIYLILSVSYLYACLFHHYYTIATVKAKTNYTITDTNGCQLSIVYIHVWQSRGLLSLFFFFSPSLCFLVQSMSGNSYDDDDLISFSFRVCIYCRLLLVSTVVVVVIVVTVYIWLGFYCLTYTHTRKHETSSIKYISKRERERENEKKRRVAWPNSDQCSPQSPLHMQSMLDPCRSVCQCCQLLCINWP